MGRLQPPAPPPPPKKKKFKLFVGGHEKNKAKQKSKISDGNKAIKECYHLS